MCVKRKTADEISQSLVGWGRWIRDSRNAARVMSAVVAADPLDAEVMSTVWMIADEEQKKRIARNFEGLDAYAYILHHG